MLKNAKAGFVHPHVSISVAVAVVLIGGYVTTQTVSPVQPSVSRTDVVATAPGTSQVRSASIQLLRRSQTSSVSFTKRKSATSPSPSTLKTTRKLSSFFGTPCVSNPKPVFTKTFMPIDQIRGLVPPGAAAGEEIKPHGYVDVDITKSESTPVYAPVDMELIEGAYYYEPPKFKVPQTYLLHFQVSCEVALLFDHITDPVEKIRAVFPKTPQSDTRTYKVASPIKVKAGELIGYTKGGGNQKANINRFDFGVYDLGHTNKFANQTRYKKAFTWKAIHAVCAYTYFTPELQKAYAKKFTSFNESHPIPEIPCKPPERDRVGTLAGAWFFRENSSAIEQHVAIALDFDAKSLTIAGLPGGYFSIRNTDPTFQDPERVTTEHCYAEPPPRTRVLYLRLLSPMKVEVWDNVGQCPSSPPTTGTIFLYR